MPASFLHGVEIIEIQNGAIPVRTLRSSVIGIVGTAPGADPEKFPLNTPVLIAASRTEAAALSFIDNDTSGTLCHAVDAILDQGGASIVVVRVEEGDDDIATKTNIIGGVSGGNPAGIQALVSADSVLGVQPRILLAPGFTQDKAVADELLSVAERLRAIVLIDGPNTTDADAITCRDEFDNPRGFLIDPWLKAAIDGAVAIIPASPCVAGLIAKIDSDKGLLVESLQQHLARRNRHRPPHRLPSRRRKQPRQHAQRARNHYKFQPPTPAEHIIYESQVVTEYFDVLFK